MGSNPTPSVGLLQVVIRFVGRFVPSQERWPSGLRRTLGKRVYVYAYRGFESLSLRLEIRFGLESFMMCRLTTRRKVPILGLVRLLSGQRDYWPGTPSGPGGSSGPGTECVLAARESNELRNKKSPQLSLRAFFVSLTTISIRWYEHLR